MENSKIQRFICKDKIGLDLFFIELTIISFPVNIIYLRTSLNRDLSDNPLVEAITEEYNSEERRIALIALLFIILKQLPGISKEYFDSYYLNWDGSLSDIRYNMVMVLLQEKEFPDYTVFSKNINAVYFQEINKQLAKEIRAKECEFVSREFIEKIIVNNIDLQLQYVEEYSKQSEFFLVKQSFEDIEYQIYVIAINKNIGLFFIQKKPDDSAK